MTHYKYMFSFKNYEILPIPVSLMATFVVINSLCFGEQLSAHIDFCMFLIHVSQRPKTALAITKLTSIIFTISSSQQSKSDATIMQKKDLYAIELIVLNIDFYLSSASSRATKVHWLLSQAIVGVAMQVTNNENR